MSRVNDEKRYSKSGTKPQEQAKKPINKYVVYRPTVAEREAVRAQKTTIAEVMAAIARFVERDAKLTIGYKADNGAYFVHLTDIGVDWLSAVTLSVWHQDMETALRTLEYGLRDRYATFPEIQLQLENDDLSW